MKRIYSFQDQSFLKDSINSIIVFKTQDSIHIIKCKEGIHKIYPNHNNNKFLKLEMIKGYVFLSNTRELFLFDKNLNLCYNSWDYIFEELQPEKRLGLAGVRLKYNLDTINKNIIIKYELFSDIEPVFQGSVIDTIKLPLTSYTPNH